MDHLKKKKLVVLCLCMGFFVFITLGFVSRPFASAPTDEELIIKTFKQSGAEMQGLNVRGWSLIAPKDYSGDPRAFLEQRAEKLFQKGSTTIFSNADEGLATTTLRGLMAKDILGSLTLAVKTGAVTKHKETYLVLSLESRHPDSYRLMKKMYSKIMRDEKNKSIIIYGFINKKLSPSETNTVVEKMVKSASVQNVETLAERGMVSVSGYSPNVRSMLTLDGKWVNINMALRYNSLEKRTFVYVGSPVITIEY